MGINLDKPHLWKSDIIQSVDLYIDGLWILHQKPLEKHVFQLQKVWNRH